MKRTISHTEVTAVYECQAKHAFGYTGRLTGGKVLKSHAPAARLRAGRAWGRGVAAFHMSDPGVALSVRYGLAWIALNESLDEDAAAMREHGFYDESEHHDMVVSLAAVLWHYALATEPLTITDPEFKLRLPIPSRTGTRPSNRYYFEGYLDGLAVLDHRLWLVEYKLRDSLSEYEDVVASPQIRRYVWAAERQLGVRIAGIIVDERLSVAPKPARWVRAKRKGEGIDGRVPSEATNQMTTGASYVEACEEAGVEVNSGTVAALDSRVWQKRHRIVLRRSEIEEAGQELVSAAQYIALLDSGALAPVRNRAPWRCRGCAFKSICNDPTDHELIEANFRVSEPKRSRLPVEAGAS